MSLLLLNLQIYIWLAKPPEGGCPVAPPSGCATDCGVSMILDHVHHITYPLVFLPPTWEVFRRVVSIVCISGHWVKGWEARAPKILPPSVGGKGTCLPRILLNE